MKKLALALALTAAATTAMAQSGAVFSAVEGLVTFSAGDLLTNAAVGMAVPENARVLTTANAKVTIKFPSGCAATLISGQSMAVSEEACKAFVRSTTSGSGVGGGSGIAGSSGIAGGIAQIAVLSGIGAGLTAYNVSRNRNNNTPTPPRTPISNN